jgi:hypothetical protein
MLTFKEAFRELPHAETARQHNRPPAGTTDVSKPENLLEKGRSKEIRNHRFNEEIYNKIKGTDSTIEDPIFSQASSVPFVADAVRGGNTILVGEVNLSFSKSLAGDHRVDARGLTATTYEGFRSLSDETRANAAYLKNLGAIVLHGIDATKLRENIPGMLFDTIIFQFPNAGSREPSRGHNRNFVLLRRFLKSAKDILREKGRVLVTTVDNAYYDGRFRIEEAIEYADLPMPLAVAFSPKDYPTYDHVNTNEGEDSALSKYRKFSTWVFHK